MTPAHVQRVIRELLAQFEADEAELLRSMLAAPDGGTVEDACHASRLLYDGLSRLPEESRVVLSRALVRS